MCYKIAGEERAQEKRVGVGYRILDFSVPE